MRDPASEGRGRRLVPVHCPPDKMLMTELHTHSERGDGGRDGCHNLMVFIGSVSTLNPRSKDYSAPVSFVSAGLRKSAAEENQQQQQQIDGGSDDSDNDNTPTAQPPPRDTAPKKLQTVGVCGVCFMGP
jgi:hypothetical protein